MKKSITFSNGGKLVLFSIIIVVINVFISCVKESNGSEVIPPPPPSFSVSVNSITPAPLVWDGTQNAPYKVVINVSTTNATGVIHAKIDGKDVPWNGGSLNTDTLFTANPSVSLLVSDDAGHSANPTVPITTNISPVVASVAFKWENTFREYKGPGDTSWQPWNIPASEVGNILVIYANGIWKLFKDISLTQTLQVGTWYLAGNTVTNCGFPKPLTYLNGSTWDVYYTDPGGTQQHYRYTLRS